MQNTQQQIDKQVQDDLDKFYNSEYAGKVEIPDNIIELFKKGYMAMPSFAHKVLGLKVKALASRQPKELLNGDVKDIVKIIMNVSPDKLYGNFEDAVASHIQLERFFLAFNNHVSDFEQKLIQKKTVLTDLSRNVNSSGLRIVPQA